MLKDIEHYTGCLLGGAVGDALGAPIEFNSLAEIRTSYGYQGITGYVEIEQEGVANFTDDTQMTLFTAEGLLQAHAQIRAGEAGDVKGFVHQAYLRWLKTQQNGRSAASGESGLLGIPRLYERRAPGNTCLSGLLSGKLLTMETPINDSKGCGGVMRVAPVGLASLADPFHEGCETAALTHGHPSGYLSTGCLALILHLIVQGVDLRAAVEQSLEELVRWPKHQETLDAVRQALGFADDPAVKVEPETIERMGGAWVGEEALAISLYCALVAPDDFRRAVLLSVNHGGDSDSTGAITGNLLGLLLGKAAIPQDWLAGIELREVIEVLAEELLACKE